MAAENNTFMEACGKLFAAFFDKHHNDDLRDRVSVAMASLLKHKMAVSGQPGGWAAGIIYAVGNMGSGVPGVINSQLEKSFGVTMATIRKLAWAVSRLLSL